MDAKTAIDTVIRVRDGTDPADAANANRRVELLVYLNQMNQYIENYRDWSWTYGTSTLNFIAGQNYIGGPSDYMEVGRNGGVWDTGQKIKYREISRHMLFRMRFELTAQPRYFFCVLNATEFHLPYTPTANFSLELVYRFKPTLLVDNTSAIELPDRWARTVLVPALEARAQLSKDDVRQDWTAYLRDGLSQMCAVENPVKSGVQKLPMVYRGSW